MYLRVKNCLDIKYLKFDLYRIRMNGGTSTLAVTVIENIEHLCEWEECNETHPLAQLPAHMRKCCYRFRIFIQFLAFSRTNHSGKMIIVF